MDPNANLAEQRILQVIITRSNNRKLYALERLADLAKALDEWISKGGSLPDEWRMVRPRPHRRHSPSPSF
jgi:hypothetical protein